MCNNCFLEIPDKCMKIFEGSKVRLGRFETQVWVLHHGWYTCNGNRPHCGWYFVNLDNPSMIKPVSLPDLYDIYLVEK